MPNFIFSDVFKRIIEVGWGSGIYLAIVFTGTSVNSSEGSEPPIFPLDMEAIIRDWDDEEPIELHDGPREPSAPQPPDYDPIPEIVDPPSSEMKAFYKYWSLEPEIEDESDVTTAPAVVTIEPDVIGAWLGPWYQFAHASEDDASAYITQWRALNPGWASIGWIIYPAAEVTIGQSVRTVTYVSIFKLSAFPANDDGVSRYTFRWPDALDRGGGINGTLYLTTLRWDADNNEVLIDEEEKEIISFDAEENLTIFDEMVYDIVKATGEITEVT